MCLCYVVFCVLCRYSLARFFVTSSYLNVYLAKLICTHNVFLLRQWRHICFPSKFDSCTHAIGTKWWQLNSISIHRLCGEFELFDRMSKQKSFQRRSMNYSTCILSEFIHGIKSVGCVCCCLSPVDVSTRLTKHGIYYLANGRRLSVHVNLKVALFAKGWLILEWNNIFVWI